MRLRQLSSWEDMLNRKTDGLTGLFYKNHKASGIDKNKMKIQKMNGVNLIKCLAAKVSG
jgi:hypothetical protein